jgi:hypothetical protein
VNLITPRRFELCKEIWRLVGREPFIWQYIEGKISEPIGEFRKLTTTRIVEDCGYYNKKKSGIRIWKLSDTTISRLVSRVGPADETAEQNVRRFMMSSHETGGIQQ